MWILIGEKQNLRLLDRFLEEAKEIGDEEIKSRVIKGLECIDEIFDDDWLERWRSKCDCGYFDYNPILSLDGSTPNDIGYISHIGHVVSILSNNSSFSNSSLKFLKKPESTPYAARFYSALVEAETAYRLNEHGFQVEFMEGQEMRNEQAKITDLKVSKGNHIEFVEVSSLREYESEWDVYGEKARNVWYRVRERDRNMAPVDGQDEEKLNGFYNRWIERLPDSIMKKIGTKTKNKTTVIVLDLGTFPSSTVFNPIENPIETRLADIEQHLRSNQTKKRIHTLVLVHKYFDSNWLVQKSQQISKKLSENVDVYIESVDGFLQLTTVVSKPKIEDKQHWSEIQKAFLMG